MQIEQSEKQPLSILGKKVYNFNPLIARKEIIDKNEQRHLYEDIEGENK